MSCERRGREWRKFDGFEVQLIRSAPKSTSSVEEKTTFATKTCRILDTTNRTVTPKSISKGASATDVSKENLTVLRQTYRKWTKDAPVKEKPTSVMKIRHMLSKKKLTSSRAADFWACPLKSIRRESLGRERKKWRFLKANTSKMHLKRQRFLKLWNIHNAPNARAHECLIFSASGRFFRISPP